MRYKVVPGPVDRDLLDAVREAVPLVPGSTEDCCTRIRDRTGIPSRERAREWLTFCQALRLVAETDRGYYRVREAPDDGALGRRFRERVFGAEEVLAAVERAEGPIDAAAAFAAVRGAVPRWERSKHADWEAEWRGRVDRLLGWAVAFGLLEEGADGYLATGDRAA